MLLLEFEFQLECMNFKPYPSTFFLMIFFALQLFPQPLFLSLMLRIAPLSFVETFLMLHTLGACSKHM